ncbi:MAG: S1 RNA-binding domain-containing protein, partial [Deltaproteobacteria bacterium]|nr:S1 RNA-binding domain-containing protein [Deltaproteobacteria bacterium]
MTETNSDLTQDSGSQEQSAAEPEEIQAGKVEEDKDRSQELNEKPQEAQTEDAQEVERAPAEAGQDQDPEPEEKAKEALIQESPKVEGVVEEEGFAALYEQSLERIQEGSVVKGTVVQMTDDFVVVDVGAKSEGQIPLQEFADSQGSLEINEGDEVEVLLESSEDDEGAVRLSRSKAARIKVWEKIAEAYKDNAAIEGTIVARVKGGLSVDVGVQAFLPGSQVDLRPARDMEQFIGQSLEFRVLKYSKKRSNVVLSR